MASVDARGSVYREDAVLPRVSISAAATCLQQGADAGSKADSSLGDVVASRRRRGWPARISSQVRISQRQSQCASVKRSRGELWGILVVVGVEAVEGALSWGSCCSPQLRMAARNTTVTKCCASYRVGRRTPASLHEFGGVQIVEWQPNGARLVPWEFRPSTAGLPVNTEVKLRPIVGGMGTVAWSAERTVTEAGHALSYRCSVALRAGGLKISVLTAAPPKATARSWVAAYACSPAVSATRCCMR